ncbi:MAG TPA: ActS/PrrB/RegB family redox-sensitive histidine kinase [Vineibacter sp.]|nr:ActS/PrrB/RegB family redox-sensitive histidine kinase [Vineibacter sp.]
MTVTDNVIPDAAEPRREPAPATPGPRRPAPPTLEEITQRLQSRGGVRLRSLVLIRWIAVAGQAFTAGVVTWGFDYSYPIVPVAAAIALSAALNLGFELSQPGATRLNDREAAVFLGFDTLQLTFLLFFTGGISNPFSLLLLAPVAIAGSTLGVRSVIVLSTLTTLAAGFVALFHFPLPWDGPPPELPTVYMVAIWASLTLSIILIAIYTWRVAEEARQMGDALAAASAALAHEQRMASLGALAAAAAHELGSPLSTISLAAREMQREVEVDDPLKPDVDLLVEQSERCRTILARLTVDPAIDVSDSYTVVSVPTLVEAASQPWRTEAVEIAYHQVRAATDAPDTPPVMVRGPEFLQGIGNLVHNATGFARTRVDVSTRWTRDWVEVEIGDDGPGIPETLLDELGTPFISTRAGRSGHMGLGTFIAKTLLERTGATVRFDNRPTSEGGGAQVLVRWRNPVFRDT